MTLMHTTEDCEIHHGVRGDEFASFIKTILSHGKLKSHYITELTKPENLEHFSTAFTAASANTSRNSEVFEQLGDLCINKFIVQYMYRRFPELNCPDGVKVVARLRINLGSKQSFYEIGEKLEFWKYISASVYERYKNMKALIEDAFEAFFGCTEFIVDSMFRPGVGFGVAYQVLESIFNEIPISLQFEDLYDAKTRLKEIFDTFGDKLGKLEYQEDRNNSILTSSVFMVKGRSRQFLGRGSAALKANAQQKAAKSAIVAVEKLGYRREEAEFYRKLAKTYPCDAPRPFDDT
jgi:dsRNA-specific ribonuclease